MEKFHNSKKLMKEMGNDFSVKLMTVLVESEASNLLSITKRIKSYGLSENQILELLEVYLIYRPKDNEKINVNLREILCNGKIAKACIYGETFNYDEFKAIISYYLFDNNIYKLIIKSIDENKNRKGAGIIKIVEKYLAETLSKNQKMFGISKDKQIDYSKLLSIITANINIFGKRSHQDIMELIYESVDDESGVLLDIATNNDILECRTIEEQLNLMKLFLLEPYTGVNDLIIDKECLYNLNYQEQLKFIYIYIKNKDEKNFVKIKQEIKQRIVEKQKKAMSENEQVKGIEPVE